MTREEAIKALREHFENNEGDFEAAIEDLDSWNGWLGDDRYYHMDELDEIYHGVDPIEILSRAFYGYDSETWHTDSHGDKEYGAFNPNREYFYFNGYGNLVSADYKDYSDKLDDYFCEEVIDNYNHLDLNEEVIDIIESIEEEEE